MTDPSREVVVAGVDVGGTWTGAVVLGPGGDVVGRARLATNTDGPDRILEGVEGAIEQALAGRMETRDLAALGVGIPGQVDPGTGTVRLAMNLRIDGAGLPIGSMLRRRLGVPTTVENDVRAAAVGAYERLRATTHPAVRSLAYLNIGTGISAGVVLGGRLHRGRDGLAGEIGHVVVDPDGPECRCGLRGCLEAVAAGPAIQRMWPTQDGRPAEALFRAAASGDREAGHVMEEVVDRYVLAIQWLATAWDADLIVLGGGIGSIGEPLLAPVRDRLAARAARSDLAGRLLPPGRVVAVPAGLPAGALGAATLARGRTSMEMKESIDDGSGDPSGRGE